MIHILRIFLIITVILSSGLSYADPLTDLQQQIKQHKGQVIYLDFWASWCGPCRKSFPWLEQMKKEYSKRGLYVISINLDNNPNLAKKFLREIPVSFSVIYDPKGIIAEKFQLKGMPSGFILNRLGEVEESHVGFFEGQTQHYEQQLQRILKG